jgi:hypothetical protein
MASSQYRVLKRSVTAATRELREILDHSQRDIPGLRGLSTVNVLARELDRVDVIAIRESSRNERRDEDLGAHWRLEVAIRGLRVVELGMTRLLGLEPLSNEVAPAKQGLESTSIWTQAWCRNPSDVNALFRRLNWEFPPELLLAKAMIREGSVMRVSYQPWMEADLHFRLVGVGPSSVAAKAVPEIFLPDLQGSVDLVVHRSMTGALIGLGVTPHLPPDASVMLNHEVIPLGRNTLVTLPTSNSESIGSSLLEVDGYKIHFDSVRSDWRRSPEIDTPDLQGPPWEGPNLDHIFGEGYLEAADKDAQTSRLFSVTQGMPESKNFDFERIMDACDSLASRLEVDGHWFQLGLVREFMGDRFVHRLQRSLTERDVVSALEQYERAAHAYEELEIAGGHYDPQSLIMDVTNKSRFLAVTYDVPRSGVDPSRNQLPFARDLGSLVDYLNHLARIHRDDGSIPALKIDGADEFVGRVVGHIVRRASQAGEEHDFKFVMRYTARNPQPSDPDYVLHGQVDGIYLFNADNDGNVHHDTVVRKVQRTLGVEPNSFYGGGYFTLFGGGKMGFLIRSGNLSTHRILEYGTDAAEIFRADFLAALEIREEDLSDDDDTAHFLYHKYPF